MGGSNIEAYQPMRGWHHLLHYAVCSQPQYFQISTLSNTKTGQKPDFFSKNRTLLMHIIDSRSDTGARSGKPDPFEDTA